jgi:hypothetical protein
MLIEASRLDATIKIEISNFRRISVSQATSISVSLYLCCAKKTKCLKTNSNELQKGQDKSK